MSTSAIACRHLWGDRALIANAPQRAAPRTHALSSHSESYFLGFKATGLDADVALAGRCDKAIAAAVFTLPALFATVLRTVVTRAGVAVPFGSGTLILKTGKMLSAPRRDIDPERQADEAGFLLMT
jgi:hypothetical protein